jgi:hypothetical protein
MSASTVRIITSSSTTRTLVCFAGCASVANLRPFAWNRHIFRSEISLTKRCRSPEGDRDPDGFAELIDKLIDASASYLVRQLQAGADAVQIFDTWAGVLPADEFHRWVVGPTQRIIAKVRSHIPGAKKV